MKPAKLVLENGKEIFIGATSYNGDVVVIKVFDERENEIGGGSLFTINSRGFARIGCIDSGIGLPTNSAGKLRKNKG